MRTGRASCKPEHVAEIAHLPVRVCRTEINNAFAEVRKTNGRWFLVGRDGEIITATFPRSYYTARALFSCHGQYSRLNTLGRKTNVRFVSSPLSRPPRSLGKRFYDLTRELFGEARLTIVGPAAVADIVSPSNAAAYKYTLSHVIMVRRGL